MSKELEAEIEKGKARDEVSKACFEVCNKAFTHYGILDKLNFLDMPRLGWAGKQIFEAGIALERKRAEELVEEFKTLYDELMDHYNRVKCPQCKIKLEGADDALAKYDEGKK